MVYIYVFLQQPYEHVALLISFFFFSPVSLLNLSWNRHRDSVTNAVAYAAVISLQHIIENIQQQCHVPHLISICQNPLIATLRERAKSIQDFLEHYTSPQAGSEDDKNIKAERLESQIVAVVHAGEDILESYVVEQIRNAYSFRSHKENISIQYLEKGLEKVIKDLDRMEQVVNELMKEKETQQHDEEPIRTSVPPPRMDENVVPLVGFNEYLFEVREKLIRGSNQREVICIHGMGGVGKTELARNIHVDQSIVEHFNICAWATTSEHNSIREILSCLLRQIEGGFADRESRKTDDLDTVLYQALYDRSYLIILDDTCSVYLWEDVRRFFPDTRNGSRIVITTRISNFSFISWGLKVEPLGDETSWSLLCSKVFGHEKCPPELQELGRMIAQKCKGLPLYIRTMGRLLKASKKPEYWKYVSENATEVLSLEDDGRILNILSSSYFQLPIQLKPCFLYMGVFPKNDEIHVPTLVKLWIAEGFVKPTSGKSLEEVAEEYLHDLIGRNLISVKAQGSRRKVKTCTIDDLLKKFCVREPRGEKFLQAIQIGDEDTKGVRRIAINNDLKWQFARALESAPFIRSATFNFSVNLPFQDLELLRVLNNLKVHIPKSHDAVLPFNSRYICVSLDHGIRVVPSSLCLLWNIQTLYIDNGSNNVINLPVQIWEMGSLRHLIISPGMAILLEPPFDNTHVGLWNLQKISTLLNFKCSEEIAQRMPNLKKLKVVCDQLEIEESSDCGVNNLCLLLKLESLSLSLSKGGLLRLGPYWEQGTVFPHTLKKLYLSGCSFPWESMKMIGRLPNLEVLKLWNNAFSGDEWEVCENEFLSLKTLQIADNHSLKYWFMESNCFPRLESLDLRYVHILEEIPEELGITPTLQSISVCCCSDSVVHSALAIEERRLREYMYNKAFQVLIN